MKNWTDELTKLGACRPAVAFCSRYPSIEEAWAACTRAEWMFWYIARNSGNPGSPARLKMLGALVECISNYVDKSDKHLPEAIKCLNTLKSYIAGSANINDVTAAAAAAHAAAKAAYDVYAAADDAYAADGADAATAHAAAYAANAADAAAAAHTAACAANAAAHAVAYDARAAAYAANATAHAARATRAAAYAAANAAHADIVRKHYPFPPTN